MLPDSRVISPGAKAGATVRRRPVCSGRSMAINIGVRTPSGGMLAIVLPSALENRSDRDSTLTIGSKVDTDQ
jgi:hypothetical protein